MMLAASFALFAAQAEAARLGGGKSVGRQSQNVTNREATPPQAPQAAPGQAAQAQPGMRPNQTPAAQPQRNRWLGPIAGLAAGLGLAALASHLGFGEELASFIGAESLEVLGLDSGTAHRLEHLRPQGGVVGWQFVSENGLAVG